MTPEEIAEARRLYEAATADIPPLASDEEIDRRVHERTVAERTFMMRMAPPLLTDLEQARAEMERLRANYAAARKRHDLDYKYVADQLFASCICNRDPETTEGPEEDCPVHGMEEFRPLALRERAQRTEAELEQRKRGAEELGKTLVFLAELIKAAYVQGADDPIGALHMLGNHLAEVLESEGGLSVDEFNRVHQALEARRADEEKRQREGDEQRRAEVSRSLAETARGGAR